MHIKFYSRHIFSLLLGLILCIANFHVALAQTPGLIYKPAVGTGRNVLDPNGDGYVSVTRTPPGFNSVRDEGSNFSEIPYRPFPALVNEPTGDLTTGSSGGHTDLVSAENIGSTGSPIAAFFNGTHLMFRIRLGGASTASKGYSVLIDTNNKFGDLVTGGNLSTTPNPGFEFEVVLASNFDVSIYDHRGKPNGGSKIWTGSADQFSQRAVAASTYSGNPDYFYDFFVPLSAFPTTGADLLTASTPLRMSGITVTSAQSGITGSVSDVGGVNFASYNFVKQAAWDALINTFPATSLNQLQAGEFPKIAAVPPVVNSLIQANSTAISGTSVEAAGSSVTVFRNGTAIQGTATVSENGTWTLAGIASTLLVPGDQITATVTPANKTVSALSNPVTVTSGLCTATPAPIITGMNTTGQNRIFTGTTSLVGNQRIRVYATSAPTVVVATAELNATTSGAAWSTSNVPNLADNSFFATATPLSGSQLSGCESLRSNQICYRNGQPNLNNQTVQITSVVYDGVTHSSATNATWSEIPTNVTRIAGTLALGGTNTVGNITIFRNGSASGVSVPFTTNTTTWSIDIPASLTALIRPGDVLNVRTDITLSGGGQTTCPNSYSSASNLLTVQATTTAPTINAPGCGNITTLTGTSSEPAGTIIQFYTGGTAGARNGTLITQRGNTNPITATVTSQGTWAASFTSAAGGGIAAGTSITARAKASGKVRSLNSAPVSGALPLAVPQNATFTINTIAAPASTTTLVTISGTGPASTTATTYEVSLNVEGTLYPPVATTAAGTWELKGLSGLEIFPGAVVTATFSSRGAGCPSAPITTTVQCRALTSTYTTTLSPNPASICHNGTVSVILSGSQPGVSYVITNNDVPTGASVLGTGGQITLLSGPLTTSTNTLSVRALEPGSTCAPTMGIGGNKSVTVAASPNQPVSLTSSTSSGCSSVTTDITLNGPTVGYTYQLIDANTKTNIGNAVTAISTNSITLASNQLLYATTTYGLRITPTGTGACTSESTVTTTVTVDQGPLLRRAVTIDKPTPCAGEQVTISVATEFNSAYTYTIRDNAGNAVGTSFTGTGAVVSRTTTYAGGITGTRSFYVEVAGGCATTTPVRLATTVSATPSATPVTADAGSSQTACGTVTLNANSASPGIGTWTKTGGPAGGTITEPNNSRTTVTGLPSGIHTFTWTIVTNCGQTSAKSSASVTITVNCRAEYVITPPRFLDEYKGGDILATATDSDGGIRNASVIGGSLPVWAELLSNGNILVRQGQNPVSGDFTFTVRTTDGEGFTTDIPLTIRIYGQSPVIIPLPVELVYFTARVRDHQVQLEWLTASEQDNDRFEVERSRDAKAFEKVGTVKGKGTSSVENKYTFTDRTPVQGTVYYRLKQVDYDGEFAYSRVIAVNAKGLAQELVAQVYPNPFQDVIRVTLTVPEEQAAAITIFDLNGRRIMTRSLHLEAGINRLAMKLAELRPGVYILHVVGESMGTTTRIMKN